MCYYCSRERCFFKHLSQKLREEFYSVEGMEKSLCTTVYVVKVKKVSKLFDDLLKKIISYLTFFFKIP